MGDVDFEDWGGSDADFVLLRGFGSCEGTLPRGTHSGLDSVRRRVRDGG